VHAEGKTGWTTVFSAEGRLETKEKYKKDGERVGSKQGASKVKGFSQGLSMRKIGKLEKKENARPVLKKSKGKRSCTTRPCITQREGLI